MRKKKRCWKTLKLNFKMRKQWIVLSAFCVFVNIQAQEKQEEIEKEDVVVEFSFNPTLSDVFKLKTSPTIKEKFDKKEVSYQINSKEVKSDFKPVIKKASYVNVDEPVSKNYRNYIYGAAGLYGNGELDVFLRPKAVRGYQFGIDLSNYNYQNGIDDDRVDNGKIDSHIGLFLAKKTKDLSWKTNVNYDRSQIHWYGLDPNIVTPALYEDKDVKQVYNSILLGGNIEHKKGIVKSVKPSLQFFSDEYESFEVDFKTKAIFEIPVLKSAITTAVDFEYLDGTFDKSYALTNDVNYGFFNLGLAPSYSYQSENFQFSASLGVMLNVNTEVSKTNVLFLPKAVITVPLVENIMILEGGVRSNFSQNSYARLVKENEFVSPTLNIQATHTPIDVFMGLKGKLSKSIKYNTEASYKQIKNKALFRHNNQTTTLDESYQLGNSFYVLYDDIKAIVVKGNIEIAVLKNLNLGALAAFNNYTVDQEAEAWNLPSTVVETYANYKQEKWFAQVGVNIWGDRKDEINGSVFTVDGFLDVNLKGGYNINKRLNAHVNIYNLLHNKYNAFTNYQVQGFQTVAGLSYKF